MNQTLKELDRQYLDFKTRSQMERLKSERDDFRDLFLTMLLGFVVMFGIVIWVACYMN